MMAVLQDPILADLAFSPMAFTRRPLSAHPQSEPSARLLHASLHGKLLPICKLHAEEDSDVHPPQSFDVDNTPWRRNSVPMRLP